MRIYYSAYSKVKCEGDNRCNGYFDCATLAVATGKPFEDWFPVFIHEACHMDQWLDESEYWPDTLDDDYTILERHHAGEDVDDKIVSALNNIILLEADCERRAVEAIEKFGLPLDPKIYAKHANSYLLFHTKMLTTRSWYSIAPYEIKKIWSKMPDHILPYEEYKVHNAPNIIDMSIFDCCC